MGDIEFNIIKIFIIEAIIPIAAYLLYFSIKNMRKE